MIAHKVATCGRHLEGTLRVLAGKVLPMSLYGVEVATVNASAESKLISAMASATMGRGFRGRNPDLALLTAGKGDVHPRVVAYLRRVMMVRRQWHLYPDARERIDTLVAAVAGLDVLPRRGRGPITLLFGSLRDMGGWMDPAYNVQFGGQTPFNMLWDPIQLVKGADSCSRKEVHPWKSTRCQAWVG